MLSLRLSRYFRFTMKIHTGDTVVLITGKDKGKTGKVLRVLAAQNRVVVAGVNMRTRHMKKTPQRAGQRIRYEASLDASNVMLFDPKTKKRTRIGYRVGEGGKKRFARRSGELLASGKALKKLAEEEQSELSTTDEAPSTTATAAKDAKKAKPKAKKSASQPPTL